MSGVRDSLARKVVDYLHEHCPPKSGLMIFNSSNTCPGYEIFGMGDTRKEITEISGLPLVIEKSALPASAKPRLCIAPGIQFCDLKQLLFLSPNKHLGLYSGF